VSVLSRYARPLSAGWSSMQSEHNARTPAVSPDAAGSSPKHVETQVFTEGSLAPPPHTKA